MVDRLVDPLVGGIHAGGVTDMSAAAVYPLLLAVAQRRGGFMRSLAGHGRRPAAGPAGPEAVTGRREERRCSGRLEGGLGTLGRHGWSRSLAARGVTMRDRASPVEALDRRAGGGPAWVLHTGEGPVVADGVVLAVPAGPAADLLAPHDDDAATLLRGIDYASVGVVTFAYPAERRARRPLTGPACSCPGTARPATAPGPLGTGRSPPPR